MMLVGRRLCDERFELVIVHDVVDLQPEITEGGQEIVLFTPSLNVMGVRKGKVERPNQVGILGDDLGDVLGRERLRPKTTLDLGQYLRMDAILWIEDGGEGPIFGTYRDENSVPSDEFSWRRWGGRHGRTEPVEKVPDRDPDAVRVYRLLQTQAAARKMGPELILWDAVEKGNLFHDLVNRCLDGRVTGRLQRVR